MKNCCRTVAEMTFTALECAGFAVDSRSTGEFNVGLFCLCISICCYLGVLHHLEVSNPLQDRILRC